MKVEIHIGDRFSSKSAHAIISVDAGETADIEEMKRLIDGAGGHFGLTAKLIASRTLPKDVVKEDHRGIATVKTQFGFDDAAARGTVKRYYEVRVNRD